MCVCVYVCVCACACMCMCVHACVGACLCVCVCACMHVHAMFAPFKQQLQTRVHTICFRSFVVRTACTKDYESVENLVKTIQQYENILQDLTAFNKARRDPVSSSCLFHSNRTHSTSSQSRYFHHSLFYGCTAGTAQATG